MHLDRKMGSAAILGLFTTTKRREHFTLARAHVGCSRAQQTLIAEETDKRQKERCTMQQKNADIRATVSFNCV